MSTELVKKETITQALEIDNAVKQLFDSQLNGFALTLMKAKVVGMISAALTTEVLKPVMEMQGKKYGFQTDLKEPYREDIVRDCLIEATLRGVECTGNQFNIIGGNCYITKEGCTHILKKNRIQTEIKYGLSKLQPSGTTTIMVTIDWVNGNDNTKGSKTIDFPVKVSRSEKFVTSEEAIQGKAERKIKAWLIEHLTGIDIPDGDTIKTEDTTYEEIKETKKTQPTETTTSSFQEEFNKVISNKDKIKTESDLKERAKAFCAKRNISSDSLDLTLFNKILKELENAK